MGFNPNNFQDSQQKLMNMLVENVFKRNGIKTNSRNLSSQQKREIRNSVLKLQQQTEQFLKNMQRNVTENDVNEETNLFEDVAPAKVTKTPNTTKPTIMLRKKNK